MLKDHIQSLIQIMIPPGTVQTPIAPRGLLGITDGASLAAAMGFATSPDWLGKGNESSGMSDLVGSDNLSGVGTPTYEVTSPDFNDLTVETSENTTDALEAANATVNDPGAGSFASLWFGELVTMSEFSSYSVFGKRESGGSLFGWELITNGIVAGDFRFRVTTDTVANEKPHTVVHSTYKLGPQLFLFVHNVTGKTSTLYSLETSAVQTWFTNGDMVNTASFSLGAGRLNAANIRHGLAAYWEGVVSEGLNATHVANLKSYLGI